MLKAFIALVQLCVPADPGNTCRGDVLMNAS